MRLAVLTLCLVVSGSTTARAETWTCGYKGSWLTTKTQNSDVMNVIMVWEGAGGQWAIHGEYDDKYGHASIAGTCDARSCKFEQKYQTGKLVGKAYSFAGTYTDRELSNTSSENTIKGTWGYVGNRTNGGVWNAVATCNQNPAAATAPSKVPTLDTLANKMSEASVIKALGAPATKGPPTEQPATGEFTSDWSWNTGVSILFTSSKKTGPFTTQTVIVKKPSTLKSDAGQGIGSTRAEVEKAYKNKTRGDGSDATRLIFQGTADSIMFTFSNGKVTEIWRGPVEVGE